MASSAGRRRSSPSRSSRASARASSPVIARASPGTGSCWTTWASIPILDLDLRLGEASGAALAMGVIVAAVAIRDEMATFDSAGIAGPS